MKQLKKIIILALVAIGTASVAQAQSQKKIREQEKAIEVKKLLDGKSFIFKAQTALPLRGGTIPLTSSYEVVLKDGKVSSYLPYFGRAFTAPMNPAEGGIRFESTEYDYETGKKKRGRQTITITPKDVSQVRQMILSVSDSGYASLSVSSNNRDPISFNGIIASAPADK